MSQDNKVEVIQRSVYRFDYNFGTVVTCDYEIIRRILRHNPNFNVPPPKVENVVVIDGVEYALRQMDTDESLFGKIWV